MIPRDRGAKVFFSLLYRSSKRVNSNLPASSRVDATHINPCAPDHEIEPDCSINLDDGLNRVILLDGDRRA